MAVAPPRGALVLAEEDLRLLQAERDSAVHKCPVGSERVIFFCGQDYPVTGVGLVSMLRYAGQRSDPTGRAAMAAMHRVLEENLGDFRAFQNMAIASKAPIERIAEAVQQIIEIHTARPWRAGLRLLGYAAATLPELDGELLAVTGRGLEALTPRQLCNLAFVKLLSRCEDDERRAEFIEDLYLDFDPEAEARAKVEAMIAAKEGAG